MSKNGIIMRFFDLSVQNFCIMCKFFAPQLLTCAFFLLVCAQEEKIMTIQNTSSSTCLQALIDLKTAAAGRGDFDTVSKIDDVIASLTASDYEKADSAMAAHQYPDSSLNFVKFSVGTITDYDFITADEAYMLAWIVRRVVTYSNYVAFKSSDLFARGIGGSRPWCLRKVKGTLADLVKHGLLVPVDSSSSKSLGTVYMISPDVFDIAGAPSRSLAQKRAWGMYGGGVSPLAPLTAEGMITDDVKRLSMLLPGLSYRVGVSCLAVDA